MYLSQQRGDNRAYQGITLEIYLACNFNLSDNDWLGTNNMQNTSMSLDADNKSENENEKKNKNF